MICEHKKNGRIRVYKKVLTAEESREEMIKKADNLFYHMKPFYEMVDIPYSELNEEQKKEYEEKTCFYCPN